MRVGTDLGRPSQGVLLVGQDGVGMEWTSRESGGRISGCLVKMLAVQPRIWSLGPRWKTRGPTLASCLLTSMSRGMCVPASFLSLTHT